MKLYLFPPSPNARKVMMVARHLGLEHETEIVDLTAGGQHTPEYLAQRRHASARGRRPHAVGVERDHAVSVQ